MKDGKPLAKPQQGFHLVQFVICTDLFVSASQLQGVSSLTRLVLALTIPFLGWCNSLRFKRVLIKGVELIDTRGFEWFLAMEWMMRTNRLFLSYSNRCMPCILQFCIPEHSLTSARVSLSIFQTTKPVLSPALEQYGINVHDLKLVKVK